MWQILSVCAQSCLTLWTEAHQAPLFMGFFRQEYWSELHFLLQKIFLTQKSNLRVLLKYRYSNSCSRNLYSESLHHVLSRTFTFSNNT